MSTTSSTQYSVGVEDAGGEARVYFTETEPKHVAVSVPADVPVTYQIYIEFVARNGYVRGQKVRVPMERVLYISSEKGIS